MIRRSQVQVNLKRQGAAAVEAAVVLPIFLTVLWAIIEFGRAMMVTQLTTNAARHGARMAIVEGATNQLVTTEVRRHLKQTVGGNLKESDIKVQIKVIPAPGNPNPSNQLANARSKDVCEVNISVPYERVGYIAGRFLSQTRLKGSCAMHRE